MDGSAFQANGMEVFLGGYGSMDAGEQKGSEFIMFE